MIGPIAAACGIEFVVHPQVLPEVLQGTGLPRLDRRRRLRDVGEPYEGYRA